MQPAFADETLYYGVDRRETDESGSGDTFSGFVASDLDGTERWTVAESQGLATPTVVGNTVFTTSAGETRALDRRDGSRCWQYDVGTGIPEASPTVVGETVYATGGEVAALAARTGERRWTAMTGTRGLHGTAATDSLVAVASGNGDKGGAYGLAPEDGAVLWDAPIPRASYTPPVIGDGRVFVVTTDGTLHALGSADGSVLWRYSLDGSSYERVAVSEGTVYVKGTNDTRLFALDARDGTERWSFELGTWGRSAPAVAGGVVYVAAGVDTGVVYALDTSTGEPTTRFDLPSAPQAGPVVGDGVAVVTTGRLSTEEGHLVLS